MKMRIACILLPPRVVPVAARLLATWLLHGAAHAASISDGDQRGRIQVNASKVINRVERTMFGVNLEDLTNQCYGGLYSQLLYGESFQEHVDVPWVQVPAHIRLATDVTIGPNGQVVVDQLNQAGRMIVPVEVPAVVMAQVVSAATGREQISKWWRKVRNGDADGAFTLEREGAFRGRHSQRIRFESGQGELGIDNMGLHRWGINLVAGKPYEGVLRIKAEKNQDVHVSLLSEDGTRRLAGKVLRVEGNPSDYQRLGFTLTPNGSDEKGRFAITLKEPGSIVVGYAFLQPGEWGRFKGLPLRKDLVQALIDQGVTVLRYNGSMVNGCPDGHLYKWKEMIGPRDLRKPYTGRFNRFATHGFAIFDALNLAEAAHFLPIIGIRTDETPEDVRDLVQYLNGPIDSTWGRRRADDGHPSPYNVRHIEIGNEEGMNHRYVERFKILADAIWSVDRSMIPVVANNAWHWVPLSSIDADGNPATGKYEPKIGENGFPEDGNLQNAVEIVKFAQERGNRIWWDTHYWANELRYTHDKRRAFETCYMLRDFMDRLVPGSDLLIAPLEENGGGYHLQGALSRAAMHNGFSRKGSYLTAFAVANAMQADGPVLHWPQGKTFFNASRVWHQPAYYVDQMQSRNWEPNVVETDCQSPGDALDTLAKVSDDGKTLVLYVVNLEPRAVLADLGIAGFTPDRRTWVEQMHGQLRDFNTAAEPRKIIPSRGKHRFEEMIYRFPAYSFTVLKFTAGQ